MTAQIKQAKQEINALWKTLGEARELSRNEFAEAQNHLRNVAEHNQTIYALMADIAQAMKDLEKLLLSTYGKDTAGNTDVPRE